MKKSQIVYRYLAENALRDKKARFVLRRIAEELKVSPNTVSLAFMPLAKVGAVMKYNGYFNVIDLDKLLSFWAVTRNFDRDIAYSTYSERSLQEIEARMPSEIAYTCYSGYVARFGNDVSDYDKVYVYTTKSGMKEIKSRFPQQALSGKSDYTNVIALMADPVLENAINNHSLERDAAPLTQIYVDLWNNKDWYAYEFLKKVKKKIDDTYAKAIL